VDYDTDRDGNNEILGSVCGFWDYEIEVYNVSTLNATLINTFSEFFAVPDMMVTGYIDDDAMLDMVVGGDEASVLIWNDSLSDTKRDLRVEVRNDTNIGVHNARVIIENRDSQEVFNFTTNATGFTNIKGITLMEKNLTTETRYGPFRMDVSYLSCGTWYNITRFLNITPFTGILEERIYIGNDTDNDGITDGAERYVYESNHTSSDTDSDSILDGVECGINDTTKPSTTGGGFVADADINTTTSPTSNDTDEDGLLDGVEDSNNDGKRGGGETDPVDWDSDDDTLPDGWIDFNDNQEKDDGEYEDFDLDGVVDTGDWGSGGETDPLDNDTDSDGDDDNVEIHYGENPLSAGERRRGIDSMSLMRTRGPSGGEPGDGDGIPDDVELEGFSDYIGEVGTITVRKYDENRIDDCIFYNKFKKEGGYTDPVVIASPLSQPKEATGADEPIVPIIYNVYQNGFGIVWKDWPSIDTAVYPERHETNEKITYMVMESGEYNLPDGTEVKVGKIPEGTGFNDGTSEGVQEVWKSINFTTPFSDTPYVFTQFQTSGLVSWSYIKNRVHKPFVARSRYINENGFHVAMQGKTWPMEQLGYIAINPSKRSQDIENGEITFSAGLLENVSSNWKYFMSESKPFIAQIQECNDMEKLYKGNSKYNNDKGIQYHIAEDLRYWLNQINGSVSLRLQYPIINSPFGDKNIHTLTDHVEKAAYIKFNKEGLIKGGVPIGETGRIDTSKLRADGDGIFTKSFDNLFINEPIVIAEPVHGLNAEQRSIHIRIIDVSIDKFKFKIEKWPFPVKSLSSSEMDIVVDYMAMIPGNYKLQSGQRVEVGKISASSSGATKKFVRDFFQIENEEMPIVSTQPQSNNEEEAIVSRLTHISTEQLRVKLYEQSGRSHISEDIGYIAMESGTGKMGGSNYVVNHLDEDVRDITDEKTTEIPISDYVDKENNYPYSHVFPFIASMQTCKDPTASELRCSHSSGSVSIAIENHEHCSPGIVHQNEKIGYFAFENPCALFADRVITDPDQADSDGDGINDSEEQEIGIFALSDDSDNDGILDLMELNMEFQYFDEKSGQVVTKQLNPTGCCKNPNEK